MADILETLAIFFFHRKHHLEIIVDSRQFKSIQDSKSRELKSCFRLSHFWFFKFMKMTNTQLLCCLLNNSTFLPLQQRSLILSLCCLRLGLDSCRLKRARELRNSTRRTDSSCVSHGGESNKNLE